MVLGVPGTAAVGGEELVAPTASHGTESAGGTGLVSQFVKKAQTFCLSFPLYLTRSCSMPCRYGDETETLTKAVLEFTYDPVSTYFCCE